MGLHTPALHATPLKRGWLPRCRQKPATDADKDPQPRPPLFKGAGGMQKPCPPCRKPYRYPMTAKARNRDLPLPKGPGVCKSLAHHATSHAATDADKDPQPRPPLFKGAGGMQKSCPPCYNRCRQRPAAAISPLQRGRGYV